MDWMYTGHHISGDQIFGKFTNIGPHAKKKLLQNFHIDDTSTLTR